MPFLGNPTRSRLAGRGVQVAAVLLAVYSLVRVALFATYASALRDAAAGDLADMGSQVERLDSLSGLANTVDTLYLPTILVIIALEIAWRHQRRPKRVLQEQGEAYVEAHLARAIPVWQRLVSGCVIGLAVVAGIASVPSSTSLPTTEQLAGYATGRTISAVLWTAGWLLVIGFVVASERHLRRRIEATAEPLAAGFTVPFVAPDRRKWF